MRRFAAPLRLATLASAPPRSGAVSSKCNPCGDQIPNLALPGWKIRNPQSAIRKPQSSHGSNLACRSQDGSAASPHRSGRLIPPNRSARIGSGRRFEAHG